METADRYSRLVLWLKVALPLGALAILSTLFFVAETLDPSAAIPYADVEVDQLLRDQGVTTPAFGGLTGTGIAIALAADAIRPDAGGDPNLWLGNNINATLDLPDGSQIEIASPTGTVNASSNEATLEGGAVLEGSNGLTVNTDVIIASLDKGTVRAENGVEARAPAGTITADRMELRRKEDEPPMHHMVFEGNVRMIIEPKR